MSKYPIREIFKISRSVSVTFFVKRLDQLLDLLFAVFVSRPYGFFILFFEKFIISFRELDTNQLFDLIRFRLTLPFLHPIFPQSMIKSSGTMPRAALGFC